MKCPILQHTIFPQGEDPEQMVEECLQEDCGFWNMSTDRCGVLETSLVLQAIGEEIGLIRRFIHQYQVTFHCHYCGLTVSIHGNPQELAPPLWDLQPLVDGHNVWICDRCQVQEES